MEGVPRSCSNDEEVYQIPNKFLDSERLYDTVSQEVMHGIKRSFSV